MWIKLFSIIVYCRHFKNSPTTTIFLILVLHKITKLRCKMFFYKRRCWKNFWCNTWLVYSTMTFLVATPSLHWISRPTSETVILFFLYDVDSTSIRTTVTSAKETLAGCGVMVGAPKMGVKPGFMVNKDECWTCARRGPTSLGLTSLRR